MAVVALNRRRDGKPGGTLRLLTTAAAGMSDAVQIFSLPSGKCITVTLMPSTSTAKVQFSTSPDELVENDTANWHDWAAGDVTATTTSAFASQVTALRSVVVSGTADIIMEVVV